MYRHKDIAKIGVKNRIAPTSEQQKAFLVDYRHL